MFLKKKYELEMTIYNLENTCFACPTQFQFEDIGRRQYYFRLRHGHWTLEDITITNNWTLLAEGYYGDEWQGYCTEKEFFKILRKAGIKLKKGRKMLNVF